MEWINKVLPYSTENYTQYPMINHNRKNIFKKNIKSPIDSKESTNNVGDWGLIPGSGRSPGEWNGYPLQYSCLENSMDKQMATHSSILAWRTLWTNKVLPYSIDNYIQYSTINHYGKEYFKKEYI